MSSSSVWFSAEIREKMQHFIKRFSEYSIHIGQEDRPIGLFNIDQDRDARIVYMALSAFYVADTSELSEDQFFDAFVITDKAITGKDEFLIDAYCLNDTDDTYRKILRVFQYKLHQAENHGISPKELKNFVTIINEQFLHPEFSDGSPNNPVLAEIYEKVDSFRQKNKRNTVKVECYFINNAHGLSEESELQRNIIKDLLGRFQNDTENGRFDIFPYGIRDIESLIKSGNIPIGNEYIEIDTGKWMTYRYEDNRKNEIGLPEQVLVGVCNVNELITLQEKYHDNQLYDENVRLYLGNRKKTNKAIIETISSEKSNWFLYMNNGVSIICDELQLGDPTSGGVRRIRMKNMQIINGCQTVNALYHAKHDAINSKKFRGWRLLLRIYEINPEFIDFRQSIITATNSQNPVRSFSLVANTRLQREIGNIMKKMHIFYNRRTQDQGNGITTVYIARAALAYRATYRFEARKLRSGIGEDRVFSGPDYEEIYKSSYTDCFDNDEEDRSEEEINEYNNFLRFCTQLAFSHILLQEMREHINTLPDDRIDRNPLIRKSVYYLVGLFYAKHRDFFRDKENALVDTLQKTKENEPMARLYAENFIREYRQYIEDHFLVLIGEYDTMYEVFKERKDIDNLLKTEDFDMKYQERIKAYTV